MIKKICEKVNDLSESELYCYLYDIYDEKQSAEAFFLFKKVLQRLLKNDDYLLLSKVSKVINDIYVNEEYFNSCF